MLTLLSSLRGLLTILHAYLIADFVHSRPPGRKMVRVTWLNIRLLVDVDVCKCFVAFSKPDTITAKVTAKKSVK